MKLKSLIAGALIVTSMSAMAVDVTLSPIFTAVDLVRSAVGTVVSPFASTAASVANKEQLAAVRSDAVDFLAGGEASEALTASIKEIKARSAEMAAMSDTQIAGLIVTALE